MEADEHTFHNTQCDLCKKVKKSVYQHREHRLCQPCLRRQADSEVGF